MTTTRLPSNLRPTISGCVHLVTHVTSGHVTKMAVTAFDPPYSKTPCNTTRKPGSSIYYRTGVMSIEVLHCGNRDFRSFCSCDLDLDPMTFVYKLDPCSVELFRMCKYELPTSMLSKFIVWQTYIGYIHICTTELYTTPLRGWSNM